MTDYFESIQQLHYTEWGNLFQADTSEVKGTLNTVREVVAPIAHEVSSNEEVQQGKELNDYMDEVQV